MTAEDWKQIEKRLSYGYGNVKLKIDGYDITLLSTIEKMKVYIAIYVNGEINGKWVAEDCEIRRKFYFKRKCCVVKNAEMKKRKISKKQMAELIEKYTYYTYTPFYTSFRSLKSQLINNNDNIELKNDNKEEF